jgi:hydroxymethylglutaryl-CoA synthase
MAARTLNVGIDDMAFYTPILYFDLKEMAEHRQIAFEKLRDGLGLHKMGLPDQHEDAATMAAEAILQLMERNQLQPRQIGRLWMGTESALDGAKPTATYALQMVQERLKDRFPAEDFRHWDVLDMTFACIAATDAMLATLEWVAADTNRVGIVVASDVAKYELESSGEYTQGAGAVAVLVKANPRLLRIRPVVGVATQSEHDFYKPRRERFTETPVFDGQFSNQCYQDRMTEALAHFREQAVHYQLFKPHQFPAISERWARMAFHLPYAFHAKRIYVEQFVQERRDKGVWEQDMNKYGFARLETMRFADEKAYKKAYNAFLKSVAESALYQKFVQQKLEKAQRASGEVGNLYTASVLLALMSTLETDWKEGAELKGKRIGIIAYGSGSKAKVFEGTVCAGWQQVAKHFKVMEHISRRKPVSYTTYEALHKGEQCHSVAPEKGRFALDRIGTEGVLLGARYYKVL